MAGGHTAGVDDTPAGAPDAAPRYGPAPMPAQARRRVTAGLVALTILLAVGLAVIAYQRFEGAAVRGEMAGYEILDDRTVAVTISVTRKNPAQPVVCIVRVRARDGAETGRREILVGPGQARTVRVTATVVSYQPPFVGDIYGCGADVPGYLTTPPS